jgi:hypothetical protein
MSKIGERADRVRQVTEQLFGSVISRQGHEMVIQIPADFLGAAGRALGMSGFTWTIGPQSTRMTTKRMIGTQGQTIVCDGHEELMAFFEINVDLRPRGVRVENPDTPHSAAVWLTRPVKPAG